jgi:RNA polymerase sigma-70 factor (ECF subfamily)
MELRQGVPDWHRESEALYRAHEARLVRLARALLGDPEEAKEVVHEVFVKVMRASAGPTPPANWAAWLTRVTINACRDRRKAGWWFWWRRRGQSLDSVEIAEPADGPDQIAQRRELLDRIWHAFDGLPYRQREVFMLRHIEGWSTDAVASALQLTPGSVKRHLFRAVRRLRRALEEA